MVSRLVGCFFLGVVIASCTARPTTTELAGIQSALIAGDLNNDGVVTSVDLQLMVNVLLGTQTDPTIVARADFDVNGRVDTSDLQKLVNLLLGGGVPDAGTADAGMYGYDVRPRNTTCLAPAPPAYTIATKRVFPSLAFAQPMGLFQAPGATDRNYVLERGGKIRAFANDPTAATATTVLDITSRVNTTGEGGFLGMALHPQWATQKEVFVSYTETGPSSSIPLRSVIARYKFNTSTQVFDSANEERLMVLDQPYTNHNGGNIAFGPDGFLYISFGDGGSGGDPLGTGQRLNTVLGKMLRIDVNVSATQKYAIPSSNPFAATGTPCQLSSSTYDKPSGTKCAEIYASGFRNPWRWSFDTANGDLWVGDVGQDLWEEVDKVTLGGNYGWSIREGAHCYNAATCSTTGLTDPLVEYDHSQGSAVTGGFVYRGTQVPSLAGRFIYGDSGSGRVWATTFNSSTGKYTGQLLVATSMAVASFAQLADGEVYIISLYDGQIHQLVQGASVPNDPFPTLLTQTGCFDSTDPKQKVASFIPFDVNAALWSDGAAKERHFAIPDGTTISLNADGDFDFPVRSVLAKTFFLNGKRVETRLFMRHSDGTWAGYSYEWNDTETNATLLPDAKSKTVGTQTWNYPSRAQCLICHTAKAGRTLGPEVGQLNRNMTYPNGRVRNQVATLNGLGFFTTPLATTQSSWPRIEDPYGMGPLDSRARAYLHANCSMCHSQGTAPGPADFRYWLTFAQTNTCNVTPQHGTLGLTNPYLIAPGNASQSIVSVRMHAQTTNRMPPLGSVVVDPNGTALIDQWINSLTGCQ